MAADEIDTQGTQKGGKYAEACFGSFPGLPDCAVFAQSGNTNGRPVRFRSRPSSLHQQGAATSSRVCLRPGGGRNLFCNYREKGKRVHVKKKPSAFSLRSVLDQADLRESGEEQDHKNVIHIIITDLERMRLDAITLESDGFIERLRRKLGGSHERDLLDASDLARAADDL